jgi:exopolyphosphatase/guanosine-5'-triphosphate,3'-diphosphate pyrophosphatase
MKLSHLKILTNLAESRNYGRGKDHALQVSRLALKIYDELVKLKLVDNNLEDHLILEAAAVLHDIGLPQEPHHETGFDLLAKEIPKLTSPDPIPDNALSALLSSVLWHNERTYLKRGTIEIIDRDRSEKIAGILRIADGLDRIGFPPIDNIKLFLNDGQLRYEIHSKHPLKAQIENAQSKSDLLKKAFGLRDISFEHVVS